ncbi:MBL fold metallo-hydrolase (plasmid) [Hymenobacter aerilatus]|uniref:MBL fold metallo-hydrolase n=6 Tax=Hymenobacter TaxID=89966 RepID=A0A3R9MPT7_9BACT|nr:MULTISPECIES: MBL fold metallo-hydrolase [Hymenobacter]MBF9223389.1 MBL fold metallo-hydrolase [Hymenobacter ruricola]MBO3269164.1 MBL fold metallo-hydrolase [Hymenobacter defluvii]QNE42081.1 MBL fold metallo-hydrolase [Hymenobacter sp. NBH84]RSK45520.1 MBL fold metallo-hydrolase [Hymenobacter rigui]TGE06490.1 MBL fold metallo-hydrolase [Hymenobacter fodinae]
MRITKYIHSCLLFELDGQQILFDPGKFSFIEGLVHPEVFKDVSVIIITHNHPDHLDVAALQKIVALRQVIIISNREVATELKAHGLTVQIHEEGRLDLGVFQLLALPVQHEAILDSPLPQMTAWLVNGKVLNPADSFANNLLPFAGVEMLLLPVTAPFLTELVVADFALKMRPRQILPVHDGYLKPFFIQQRYENYGPYFEKHGIVFHRLAEPGDAITLP